jgi:hypothetical protein
VRCAPYFVALAKAPLKHAHRCGRDFPSAELGDWGRLRSTEDRQRRSGKPDAPSSPAPSQLTQAAGCPQRRHRCPLSLDPSCACAPSMRMPPARWLRCSPICARLSETSTPASLSRIMPAKAPPMTSGGQALRGSSDLHAWGDSNLYLHRHAKASYLDIEHRAAPGTDRLPLALMTNPPAPSSLQRIEEVLARLQRPSPNANCPRGPYARQPCRRHPGATRSLRPRLPLCRRLPPQLIASSSERLPFPVLRMEGKRKSETPPVL